MSIVEKAARRASKNDLGPERKVKVLPPEAKAAPAAAATGHRVRLLTDVEYESTDRETSGQLKALARGTEHRVVDGIPGSRVCSVLDAVGQMIWLDAKQYEYVDAPQNGKSVDVVAPPTNGKAGKAKPQAEPYTVDQLKRDAQLFTTAAGPTPVVRLDVDLLVRHPDNRTPSAEQIAKRAESLAAEGQLEPLRVRALAGGRYQIVSGETRWLAARKLGWKSIECRLLPADVDDRKALELLAVANAQREDLNPIEKARLIEKLCAAGETREQAAKVYGLESGAAASNLVRLLELPKVWQERVISGELPQSYARPITAIAKAPKLLDELEEDWKSAHHKHAQNWDRENWSCREAVEEFVGNLIEQTDRVDDATVHERWLEGKQRKAKRLFELTPEVRKKLEIQTVVIDGKEVEVATNAGEFWKLQEPLMIAKAKKGTKDKADADAGDDAPAKKKLTPAQAKAAAKEKDEQLQKRIDGWRSIWLKSLIAPKIEAGTNVTWRLFATMVLGGHSDHFSRLKGGLQQATGKDGSWCGHNAAQAWKILRDHDQDEDVLVVDALRAMLAEEDRDPRQPLLHFDFVDAVAVEYKIDLAAEWKKLQTSDRDRFETFLLLHTGEQLDALAAEWKTSPLAPSKKLKVEALLIRGGKPYPLPKSIKPLKAGTSKSKRGGK